MARTALTPVQASSGQAITAGVTATPVAADNTNKNSVTMSGKDLVLVQNTTGGALSVTIKSVADQYGRVGDITESIPANATKIYGPFAQAGWAQSDGKLYIDGVTGLSLAVIRLP